jgi:hypothetical protein
MAVSVNISAACIAAHLPDHVTIRGALRMKAINVYPAQSGGWIYEVWIAKRPVVVGWCHTRLAAEQQASLI